MTKRLLTIFIVFMLKISIGQTIRDVRLDTGRFENKISYLRINPANNFSYHFRGASCSTWKNDFGKYNIKKDTLVLKDTLSVKHSLFRTTYYLIKNNSILIFLKQTADTSTAYFNDVRKELNIKTNSKLEMPTDNWGDFKRKK